MTDHTNHYDIEAASTRAQIEQERADFSLVALLGLEPYRDGNMWCFLWGENLAEGVAGFGPTVRAAAVDFQRACYVPIAGKDAKAELGLAMAEANDLWNTAETIREALAALEPAPVTPAEAARVLLGGIPNPIFDQLKPVMIGEFHLDFVGADEDGNEINYARAVPWTEIKAIIRTALRALADAGEAG